MRAACMVSFQHRVIPNAIVLHGRCVCSGCDAGVVMQPGRGRHGYGGGGGLSPESFKEVRIGASVHIYASTRGPVLVTNSSPALMLKAGNLATTLQVRLLPAAWQTRWRQQCPRLQCPG